MGEKRSAKVPEAARALAAALGLGRPAPTLAARARRRLVERFGPLRPPGVEVAAFEKGAVYREKGGARWRPVPSTVPRGTALGRPEPRYRPVAYVGEEVRRELDRRAHGERTWAHADDLARAEVDALVAGMRSHTGPLRVDPATGLPLNPLGPTGVCGRGESNLGPILAQDIFLHARDPSTGKLHAVFIERKDTGRWAMPGGIEDEKDEGARVPTAVRELFEETKAKSARAGVDALSEIVKAFASARTVFRGVCAREPRNTDNTWFETTVFSVEIPWSLASGLVLEGSDDASRAALLEVTPELVAALHGDHPDYVARAGVVPRRRAGRPKPSAAPRRR